MSLWVSKNLIHSLNHHLNKIDILPLIKAANIVGFIDTAFVENSIYCSSMVLKVQPVTNIFSLSVYWERFSVTDVVDEKWNQLFWELVWAVVVRAVCYNCRHIVGIVICSYEVVAAGL